MIKSKHFWIGTILLSIIPILGVDIIEHYQAWQTDVREQIIFAVQDVYNFTKSQKATILDNAFDRNQFLTFLITFKILGSLLFLITGAVLLRTFIKQHKPGIIKPLLTGIPVAAVMLALKFVWVIYFNAIPGAKFIKINKSNFSFEQIINDNIKGKIIYVDFWGTTCGPCIAEFENFTHTLKTRYRSNQSLAYLYVARGNPYLWKRQIEKYQIDGYHIFLNDKDYDSLYHNALNNDTLKIYMPHYIIVNKEGIVAVDDAKAPSDQNELFNQLDWYLKEK